MTSLRRVEAKVDAIEERLAWQYPTEGELITQLDAEVDLILAPGSGVRVFADE
jgi:hypothetical protein